MPGDLDPQRPGNPGRWIELHLIGDFRSPRASKPCRAIV
jgi:hypothetical protein